MSICEFNVVDGAGVQNDSLILMITDHLDWISIDEETHMNMLVKKVNAYLDFLKESNIEIHILTLHLKNLLSILDANMRCLQNVSII